MKTVLVAGASGLVGKQLVPLLEKEGFTVHTLSTSHSTNLEKKLFRWTPATGEIDLRCFEGVTAVINLSGAGVFEKAWSAAYKKQILESRTQSTALLAESIVRHNVPVSVFINASGVSIYGVDTSDAWVDEQSPAANDFLANVVKQWEEALIGKGELKTRKVCLRFGIVLSDKGGALKELSTPVKYFVGSPLGTGKQYISWIHIEDLCQMIHFALTHETVQGKYNAVASQPVTNREMIREIARQLGRTLWAPAVPAFVLNTVLGKEKASMVLGGNRVKNEKIKALGFEFKYKTLNQALHPFFSYKNNV